MYPLILAHFPSSGSSYEIEAEICEKNNAPVNAIRDSNVNAVKWVKLLSQVGTKTLLIKDMNAMNLLPKSAQMRSLNTFRTVVSRFEMNLVLADTPKTRPALEHDEQLSERTQYIEVRPFKSSGAAFTSFFTAYHRWCPLQRPSDICVDKSLRKALIHHSNSTSQNLADILNLLAIFAIRNGEKRITQRLWLRYISKAEYGR